MAERTSTVREGLDGHGKPLEQLLQDLEAARKAIDLAVQEEAEAAELLEKAVNRTRDARGVYDGIARSIDRDLQLMRRSAPEGTAWRDQGAADPPEALP